MKAYTCGINKEEFVNELRMHYELDHFIKGTYSEGEKGCAVGCSIKSIAKIKGIELDSREHKNYESHLGIPEWLAILENRIFEELPEERSKTWPVEFGEAINTGSDLDVIKTPFLIFLLNSCANTLEKLTVEDDQVRSDVEQSKSCVQLMITALQSNDEQLILEAKVALAASEASWAARAASEASWAAREARAAAWAAAWVEGAAESAAWAASWVAGAAAWVAAWAAAWPASRKETYEQFAHELLRLIRECKADQ